MLLVLWRRPFSDLIDFPVVGKDSLGGDLVSEDFDFFSDEFRLGWIYQETILAQCVKYGADILFVFFYGGCTKHYNIIDIRKDCFSDQMTECLIYSALPRRWRVTCSLGHD